MHEAPVIASTSMGTSTAIVPTSTSPITTPNTTSASVMALPLRAAEPIIGGFAR
jgi:hypothetical protein